MNYRWHRWLIVSALAIVVASCGEQQLPETPPGASRSMIENPLGKAAEGKPAKVSPKAKAAMEKAAGNDPRGK